MSYVYLDHLIPREAFLYKSSQDFAAAEADPTPRVSLLMLDNSNAQRRGGFRAQLRKPDFQRATWAWTPEQCVSLLDSLLQFRVVPSVILWHSPDSFIYVLDGGHRVSVLLAYLEDDWGDKRGLEHLPSSKIDETRATAQHVRDLMRQRGIASFKEHKEADEIYWSLLEREKEDKNAVESQMNPQQRQLANSYRSWSIKDIGFSIQWVNGTYTDAEESFVRINSSGTNLSEWEIQFVRHRKSSFARLVTSLVHPEFVQRCWPVKDETGALLSQRDQDSVGQILAYSRRIADLLWEPKNTNNGDRLRPLLVPSLSDPGKTPFYIGELLTLIQGESGRQTRTEEMLKRDAATNAVELIANGSALAQKTLSALQHLRGQTSQSLGIVSSAYFYNADGIHIRSLLYGFLFWINFGTDQEVLERKRFFCAYRDEFEKAFLLKKKDVITLISRKSGSGAEVTLQTTRYFNGLLELVSKFVGKIETPDFEKAHRTLLHDIRKGSSVREGQDQSGAGCRLAATSAGHKCPSCFAYSKSPLATRSRIDDYACVRNLRGKDVEWRSPFSSTI